MGDIIGYLNEAANVKTKAQRYDTMLEQINIRKSRIDPAAASSEQ